MPVRELARKGGTHQHAVLQRSYLVLQERRGRPGPRGVRADPRPHRDHRDHRPHLPGRPGLVDPEQRRQLDLTRAAATLLVEGRVAGTAARPFFILCCTRATSAPFGLLTPESLVIP